MIRKALQELFGGVAVLFVITWENKHKLSHIPKSWYLKGLALFVRKCWGQKLKAFLQGAAFIPFHECSWWCLPQSSLQVSLHIFPGAALPATSHQVARVCDLNVSLTFSLSQPHRGAMNWNVNTTKFTFAWRCLTCGSQVCLPSCDQGNRRSEAVKRARCCKSIQRWLCSGKKKLGKMNNLVIWGVEDFLCL